MTDHNDDLSSMKMGSLRRRAKALGLEVPFGATKDELASLIAAASTPAADGLPDVIVPAPDDDNDGDGLEAKGDTPTVVPAPATPAPAPVKASRPEPPARLLAASDVVAAVNGGDCGGLPNDAKQKASIDGDGAVVIARTQKMVNAMIGGHAVACQVEITTRIREWEAKPRTDTPEGKLRLMNDVSLVMNGSLVDLKAGKEFYPHQIDQRAIITAGGVLLPIR